MNQQRTIVIPDFEVEALTKDAINQSLYLTDIGYYPEAKGHYRQRKEGSEQHILIYCIAGEGWISVGNKRFTVSKNQYFIIPRHLAHSYGSHSQHPWSIYWLHFLGNKADTFAHLTKTPEQIVPSNVDRIENRIELFEEMLQNLEINFSPANYQYANICLMHFLASFKYLEQYRQIRKNTALDSIEASIKHMRKNISTLLSLNELAEQAKLSPSQFSLLFKRKTGKSPVDYFIHLKMQNACHVLNNSDKKVKTIAYDLGYHDPYYFTRIFSKTIGMSPKRYRQTPKG